MSYVVELRLLNIGPSIVRIGLYELYGIITAGNREE